MSSQKSPVRINKLLIANRGEIARRIIRTARSMGIVTVAVYADADAKALHVRDADEAVHIGASPATESYLVIDKIIEAARRSGADAIHPGYGFLSENADLPDACKRAGIIFVGPRGDAMRALGGKAAAKEIAIKAGVPVVPGYQGKAQDLATLSREADRIGYPVMIKAVAGGGGRGMRLVERAGDLADLLDSARREAQSAFGNPDVLIEKVVVKPRHIEVQVFGDSHANAVHLFERDCTLQRRNQKVVEEAPAPGMSVGLRTKICDAAVKLAKAVAYEGAGTVEFLVEGGKLDDKAPWYFIEMNTRLQVEHPVTEEITGLDLVEWQLRVAAGEPLPLTQKDIAIKGHAIEVRLCAEDPAKDFMPSIGRIDVFEAAPLQQIAGGVRLESGVAAGSEVSPFYDSMIAKVIVCRDTRAAALTDLAAALARLHVAGVTTNARFLANLLTHEGVAAGMMDTGLIGRELAALSDQRIGTSALQAGIAALVQQEALALVNQAPAHDPWSRLDGFSLDGSRQRRTSVVIDGVARMALLDWAGGAGVSTLPRAVIDDAAADSDGNAPFDVRHNDGVTYLFERGRQVAIRRPVYDVSDIADGGDGSTIRAPINGRLAKLFVKAGDVVDKGQRIAVVEAMKMEHVLSATAAGTVERVAVEEGAQVTQNALIASVAIKPA